MYYRNLVAAMGNPHAAEAWRTACELDAECVTLCNHVQKLANSNKDMLYSQVRLKRQIDDLDAVIVKQRDAQRKLDETIDAGHEASIAFLREQAQRRLAARAALNYGLGLLVVLSAIVIGILAGALIAL